MKSVYYITLIIGLRMFGACGLHWRADCQDQLLGHRWFYCDHFHQGRKSGCGACLTRKHFGS
jgi:hypothetical protein